jgi:hypothetical protein
MKICIHLEGGVVQAVFTSEPAEIVVVDIDPHGDEPVIVSRSQPDRVAENMSECWHDQEIRTILELQNF